jgi:hypothetical protein
VLAGDTAALARALQAIDDEVVDEAIGGAAEVRRRYRWPSDEVRAFYTSLLDG